jgi:hypothetical protein
MGKREVFQVFQTLIAGVVGFLGGMVALWAQQHIAWRPQKRIELRRAVFDEALNALAMYEVDALDPALQANPPTANGIRPVVVLRLETKVQMQRARSQVQAFFPEATFEAFREALHANVRLDNIPNTEFTEKTAKALKLMARDIGLF